MKGSYYPYCSSEKRTFSKSQDISGDIIVENECLCFHAKLFMLIPVKSKDISIPLSNIVQVEPMNLNGFMPFGVCVFTKDGKEYMFGSMSNQTLANYIKEAAQI